MGQVYLALDTTLERQVAFKILNEEFSRHESSLQRFIQEARAASALNHPNILVIHEIGDSAGSHYIVSEFIDGDTLAQRMKSAPMKLREVLDAAVQIGSALSAAHAAGIVHRDIKPENIMLRRDGIVKVLDFGLAKLTERLPPDLVDTEAPTRALLNTEPGVVMGTAIYMSPEQARGITVDARTDIFSLGVLIYEMIARRLPFEGSNTNEILAAILSDKEPQPLVRYAREVPTELERIVSKALCKNRDERYQTIKDMLLDLNSLKQELEFEKKLERFAPPGQHSGSAGASQTVSGFAASATASAASTTSSASYIFGKINRHKILVGLVLAALVIASAVAGYFYFPRASKGPIDSIAVLPLANASNEPNSQYLSDGITDSLIESLSQLPNLKVMSHNSVFRYRGPDVNVQDVANKLGVRAVLTGRLAQLGDQLVINVELVDARDNRHLWGEQYTRKPSDILAVQSELAQEVARQLRARLSGEEQRRVTKSYTANTEAYRLYLNGRYYWHKFTEDDFKRALDYFQQAIDKDPNYALAYAGMADCYWQLGWYNYVPKKEAWPKAKAAIDRALERDKTVAEVHTSLATYKVVEGDWNGAEVEFKLALSLNGSDAQTHMQYSWYLDGIGQVEKAIEEAKKAYELDPLSLDVATSLGQALFYGRRYDEAIEVFQEALRSDPNSAENHAFLGSAFEQKQMYDDAIKEFLQSKDFSVERTGIGMLGHAYAVSGRTSEARKILDQLLREAPVRSYAVALIYSGLGEKDSAFLWLNKTSDDEDNRNQLVFIKVDPTFDNLRTDQRFTDLLRRMNLPT